MENTVNGVNNPNVAIANAQANQSRQTPDLPTDAYHVELLAAVTKITGLSNVEILTKAFNMNQIDTNNISITALVKLLPLDLQILTVLKTIHPFIDIDSVIKRVDGKVEILNGAKINIASAQATQTTGGNKGRDLPGTPGVDGAGATGALGTAGAAVASLTKGQTPRAEHRSLPDIIVALNVKVQSLCHDLSRFCFCLRLKITLKMILGANVSAAATAAAALDVSISILTEIKTCLVDAKAEIEALVSAHVDGVLSLNGKELTVRAIAEIYAHLCVVCLSNSYLLLVISHRIFLGCCCCLGSRHQGLCCCQD